MSSVAERRRRKRQTTVAKAKTPRPEATVVPIAKAENMLDRDGLLWLRKKRRISIRRFLAAGTYRQAFREPQEGSMKSCLDDTARGGGTSGRPPDNNLRRVDALRLLHDFRTDALKSHAEMIAVMDGVAGGGLTLREMAGGDKHRAAELETIFGLACDLIAQHLEPAQPRSATG